MRNARVALLWEDTGILDPRVPPRRHVSYYGLLLSGIGVVAGVRIGLVVALIVVFLRIAVSHARIVARVV